MYIQVVNNLHRVMPFNVQYRKCQNSFSCGIKNQALTFIHFRTLSNQTIPYLFYYVRVSVRILFRQTLDEWMGPKVHFFQNVLLLNLKCEYDIQAILIRALNLEENTMQTISKT